MILPPPSSTLFPYTTLFRSKDSWLIEKSESQHTSGDGPKCCRPQQEPVGVGVGIADVQGPRAESEKSHDSRDRKSTRLNSSHGYISYAVFCLKKKKTNKKKQ